MNPNKTKFLKRKYFLLLQNTLGTQHRKVTVLAPDSLRDRYMNLLMPTLRKKCPYWAILFQCATPLPGHFIVTLASFEVKVSSA